MTDTPKVHRGAVSALRWALLTLFVAGIVAAQLWYGNRHQFYDLNIYRQAVNWWLHGHDIYSFTKPDATQGQLGFTYPPFGAVVLVPFAVLPKGLAIVLYSVLTGAALIVTTFWLIRPVVQRHGWSLPFVMVLALTVISTLEPIRETYTFGQINILLAIAILFDLLVLLPRGSKWAGIGIGIAAAVKLTPAIFIVYLLVSRRRRERLPGPIPTGCMGRAALTAAVTAVAASLVAFALMPRSSWHYWTHTLWGGEGLGNAAYTFNQSIYAMLARFSAPSEPNRALWAVLVLIAVVAGLWRARRVALAGDEVSALTIAGLVGCLASPITWAHHLYWFVPALVVLVDVAFSSRRFHSAYGVIAVVLTLTVGLGTVSWFEQGLPLDPWSHGLQGFLIKNWYLLLTVLLVAVLPARAPDPAVSSGFVGATPSSEPAAVR